MLDKQKIENAVNEWIGKSDSFLVDIRISPAKIAVFIDKPAGITLDECAGLTRYLMDQFQDAPDWETHELEVSSPGMDQPLRVYQQYIKRIGKEVRVVTTDGEEWKGKLVSASETGIEVFKAPGKKQKVKQDVTAQQRHFNYSEIKETKILFSFN